MQYVSLHQEIAILDKGESLGVVFGTPNALQDLNRLGLGSQSEHLDELLRVMRLSLQLRVFALECHDGCRIRICLIKAVNAPAVAWRADWSQPIALSTCQLVMAEQLSMLTLTFLLRHSLQATVTCLRFFWLDELIPSEDDDADGSLARRPEASSPDIVRGEADALRHIDFGYHGKLEIVMLIEDCLAQWLTEHLAKSSVL